MRNELSKVLCTYSDEDFLFITGDLGFMTFESLKEKLGSRFINAGVAEQNMISVSAGMAKMGLKPWVYSIGPFVYARPFEQIRNDVAFHNLSVKIVGNGGGYGYGAMGSTHHSLEDYGILSTLPNMKIFVPAFNADIQPMVENCFYKPGPVYFRLGRCELPKEYALPPYASWRKFLDGTETTVLLVGPLAGGIINAILKSHVTIPNVWVVSELPITAEKIPQLFMSDLLSSQHLLVIEEHTLQGSVGQVLGYFLSKQGIAPRKFTHLYAKGYPSKLAGSQQFHRGESGLLPEQVLSILQEDAL
ncbi:hypothetical protein [Paenibacillus silviterrae]|uniref:hypothetical protein n=1 Tax=Paenibacillus silviterrae TaxID=3242194 RepID=UPI002542714F|nr:hypothetical protein [Paenibacillus chinjuensis]